MRTGILKEPEIDNRVSMLPETVAELKKHSIDVSIEQGAGNRAFATDTAYKEAGAEIMSKGDVIEKSDILLKINPPDKSEIESISAGKIMISVINPYFNKDIVKLLVDKGITSFSLDMLPRTTRAQAMDILSSMATVSGYKAVLDAAHITPFFFPMFMSAAGTIKPAKILVLGAGVAGLQAIATSRKLGAVVEVFDVRSAVKEEVMSLGGKFIEVEGAKEDKDAGGYAVEQTEEFKKKQQQLIHDHAVKSNVVICTAQIPGRKAPLLIPATTVEQMSAGSVVIDLAASTGGNCELTKNNEIIDHRQVKIVGKTDYPSQMPMDSSRMFGKNVFNFLTLFIDDENNLKLDFEDELVKGSCITHNKEIVNEKLKETI